MRLTEVLLFGMVGWTTLGVVGVGLAWVRGEKKQLRQGVAWLIGVWVIYIGIVAGVSLIQKQRVVAEGQPQCFSDMCFTVTRVEEVRGFLIRDGRRLIRVSVLITNRGTSAQNEELIRAYLVDAQGRRWRESPGVNGVGLTTRVAGGASAVSEPVYKISGDATGLKLVLTHGWRQPGVLIIGDSDSLLHKKTVVELAPR